MLWCRNLSRALAFISLSVLTGTIAVSASAAPFCARVMMPEISVAEISATVTSLAQMKSSLDLLKAKSSRSKRFSFLNGQFTVKFAELQRALNDKFTEKELRSQLTAEIERLQRGEETIQRQREIEQRTLFPNYKITESIPISTQSRIRQIGFSQKHNSIVYENSLPELGIMRIDIKSGEETRLAEHAKHWVLLPDDRTLLVSSSTHQLYKIDILTGNRIDLAQAGPSNHFKLDPRGEHLMMSFNNEIVIFDLNTGTAKKSELPNGIWWSFFLSKNKVLFMNGDAAYIKNFDTQQVEIIEKNDKTLSDSAVLSEDGDTFALYSRQGKFHFYSLSNPTKPFVEKNMNLPADHFVTGVKLIRGAEAVTATITTKDYSFEYGIYRVHDLESPIFTFNDYSGFTQEGHTHKVVSFHFSEDQQRVGVFVDSGNPGTTEAYKLEIWEKQ
jgi:hypothetical protein